MYDLSEDVLTANRSRLEADSRNDRLFRLPKTDRIIRVQQVIRALARLRGGAHLTRNLSDVSPVVVLAGFVDGGNAPFQRLFEPDADFERVRLNLSRLRSVLADYHDRLLAPANGHALFFGYRPTVLANEQEVLQALTSDPLLKTHIAPSGSPGQALAKLAEAVPAIMNGHVTA